MFRSYLPWGRKSRNRLMKYYSPGSGFTCGFMCYALYQYNFVPIMSIHLPPRRKDVVTDTIVGVYIPHMKEESICCSLMSKNDWNSRSHEKQVDTDLNQSFILMFLANMTIQRNMICKSVFVEEQTCHSMYFKFEIC
ncbi:putative mitochondrial import inner membrane translocase subunit tim16 [Iris pallida]|uniref:Mitochondrial import inner membrane translocase subunit tim16 n=1 Tax=Iris pallida TaxID=29817 RepID=A0AAX6F047_IRIPA|nr:putative mitochondrial import inner membrane translocase subunit tim16 [Iris pallida]